MVDAIKNQDAPVWLAPYGNIRADCYLLLAALLRQLPSPSLRELLQNLEWEDAIPVQLDHSMRALRQAGHDYPQAVMEDEFRRLFVAPGKGSMMPYASWYREKKIQSKTLAALRSDLTCLGIVRQEGSEEPEDHVCALCEIMSIIARPPGGLPYGAQAGFFRRHIAPWMTNFFRDLRSAKDIEFYRLVGLFGSRFLETENEYLKYAVTAPRSKQEGGTHDENGTPLQPADIP